MSGDLRLTTVLTHPIQYWSPLLRRLASPSSGVRATVIYVTEPTPEQQGAGFGVAFTWDVPLREGYESTVLRAPRAGDDLRAYDGLGSDGLEEAVRATAPDAVLLPGWNSRAYVRVLGDCARRGVPVLYRGDTTLWQAPQGWRRPLWAARCRARLGRFAACLAVGRRARIFLEANGVPPRRIHASPHAVDNEAFAARAREARAGGASARVREAAGARPGEFVVLFAGKLEAQKAPVPLVTAVGALGDGVRLLLAGDGELREACAAEAARTGARVSFLGFRNQRELPAVYAAADAVVLPSRGETWGLVVNEAMACGVPCLVSDAVGCGPDLVVPGRTGEVFHAEDPEDLRRALGRLRDAGPDPARAEACRAQVGSHDLARAAEGVVAAARAVTGRGPPGSGGRGGRRPRVLAVLNSMAVYGGHERVTIRGLAALTRRGVRAHALVSGWPGFRSRVAFELEREGIPWTAAGGRFPVRRRPTAGEALRFLADSAASARGVLRAAWRLRATHALLATEVDVLRNAPALYLLRVLGVRSVLRMGTRPVEDPTFRRLWGRWCAPALSEVVCVSRFVADQMEEISRGGRRVRVIYNDAPEPHAVPVAGAAVPGRVVYLGQVIPGKGVHNLVEAVARLRREGLDCSLDVLGAMDGWEPPSWRGYRDGLRRQVREAGLSGHVRFLGWKEGVLPHVRTASVLCAPSLVSLGEGLGSVVLEAKAAGVPAVVTPSGGLPEMVRHRVDGWVCAGDSPGDLAEGLRWFLGDPARAAAAGREARASIRPRFTSEAFESAWCGLFGVAASAGDEGR